MLTPPLLLNVNPPSGTPLSARLMTNPICAAKVKNESIVTPLKSKTRLVTKVLNCASYNNRASVTADCAQATPTFGMRMSRQATRRTSTTACRTTKSSHSQSSARRGKASSRVACPRSSGLILDFSEHGLDLFRTCFRLFPDCFQDCVAMYIYGQLAGYLNGHTVM